MKSLRVERRTLTLSGGGIVTVLAAGDPASDEIIDGLRQGEIYKIELKSDRSRGELNLYWAGLGLLVKSYSGAPHMIDIGGQPRDPAQWWPTSRHYHEMLMESTGHVYKLWRIDGTYRNVVDSIALDKMEDDDWKTYFETARHITRTLFGFDPWDEWKALKNGNPSTRQEAWQRNWRPGDDPEAYD